MTVGVPVVPPGVVRDRAELGVCCRAAGCTGTIAVEEVDVPPGVERDRSDQGVRMTFRMCSMSPLGHGDGGGGCPAPTVDRERPDEDADGGVGMLRVIGEVGDIIGPHVVGAGGAIGASGGCPGGAKRADVIDDLVAFIVSVVLDIVVSGRASDGAAGGG